MLARCAGHVACFQRALSPTSSLNFLLVPLLGTSMACMLFPSGEQDLFLGTAAVTQLVMLHAQDRMHVDMSHLTIYVVDVLKSPQSFLSCAGC
jgi:hypothetical protein